MIEQAIQDRVSALEERIVAACRRAGRPRDQVRLLPVSKTKPGSALAEAMECGFRRFGENRVQEIVAKQAYLPEAEFALIGHLQTNKAAKAAELAVEFQALDSLRVAAALDRKLQTLGRSLDVLVEVNTSGEDSKFGLTPEQVMEFCGQLKDFDSLNPIGLMTIAMPSTDEEVVGACFDQLAELRNRLRAEAVASSSWDELSMGMSNDFELAIAHGSTCIRVGTAIFGSRPAPMAV